MTVPPKTASTVIIGGGVMGASTAHHLACRGLKDVVLIERERFFGIGSTGRCAGGIRYQFNTDVNIRLSNASLPMIDTFEEETGQIAPENELVPIGSIRQRKGKNGGRKISRFRT